MHPVYVTLMREQRFDEAEYRFGHHYFPGGMTRGRWIYAWYIAGNEEIARLAGLFSHDLHRCQRVDEVAQVPRMLELELHAAPRFAPPYRSSPGRGRSSSQS